MSHLLLDTMSLFFRAYFALPAMTTRRGEPTNAVYGFSSLLLKLLREQRPKGLAVALEGGRTPRHEALAGYKASRGPPPRDLTEQLVRLHEILEAIAVPRHRATGYEADDVLATLCARSVAPTTVVSGDRDVFAVVREGVDVLFVGRRGGPHERYDRAAVEARFGVRPDQLATWIALAGDKSDDLPKVPGVGPRTATRLVQRFGDAAGLFAGLDRIEPARLRDALAAHEAQIHRVERVARLRTDAPLEAPLTRRVGAPELARLDCVFSELELDSLRPRLAALAAPGYP